MTKHVSIIIAFRPDTTVILIMAGTRTETGVEDRRTLIDDLRARRSLLTVDELCVMLGLAKRTVYGAIKAGTIPSLRVLGSIRLDPKATATWLERCAIGPQ